LTLIANARTQKGIRERTGSVRDGDESGWKTTVLGGKTEMGEKRNVRNSGKRVCS